MKNFIKYASNRIVSDVIVTGYLDSETPPVFHPMYDRIYFVIEDSTFEIYINDDGFVQSKKIVDIAEWFEVDDDDCFSLMSIYSQAFKTEQEVKIKMVNYDFNSFSMVIIEYKDGDNERLLSLDPNNFFGFTFL
ncbi:hypothetical protein V2T44_11520 [Serratia ficaria]|uniref:hypothetical protein n=1 Tax=Serratia ficaria TaxID=61651 RepID=UPI002ED2D576|nr:hypothetical protein [Serratia ficaria]